MRIDYTLKVPLRTDRGGDAYAAVGGLTLLSRYLYFTYDEPWFRSETKADGTSPIETYINVYRYSYVTGQTSNLNYKCTVPKPISYNSTGNVENYANYASIASLTYLPTYTTGVMNSDIGFKEIDLTTVSLAQTVDNTSTGGDCLKFIRIENSDSTSAPSVLSKTGGTLILGNYSTNNYFGFYDRSSGYYPPYLRFVCGSTKDTIEAADATGGYPPKYTGSYNHLFDTLYATDEIQQLDSSGKVKRIFLKFAVPSVNGRIDSAFLNIQVSSEENANKLIPVKLLASDASTWDRNSSNATMDTVYAGMTSLGLQKAFNAIIGSQNTMSVEGHPFLCEHDAYYRAIPGLSSAQFQFWSYFTIVIEDMDNTRATASTAKAATPSFGRNDLTQSARKTIIGTISGSEFRPYIYYGYVPPVIQSTLTTVSKTISCGINANSVGSTITNMGRGRLYPLYSKNVSWISSVTGSAGPIVRNGINYQDPMYPSDASSGTFTINFDTTGLAVGSYNGTVTVTATDAYPTTFTIPVSLTITSASVVALDTTTINKSVVVGNNATDSTFQVWDNHDHTGDTLSYTISDNVSWLSVSASSGTSIGSSDKKTHTISYTTSALTPGSYVGTITVSSSLTPSTKTITVNLTVTPSSFVAVSTNTINKTVTVGSNATSSTFQVWDGNSTALDSISYNVTDNVSWLSVSAVSGTSDSSNNKNTHTISYSTSSLAPGDYTGTITVNDPIRSSTELIIVNLTVTPESYVAVSTNTVNISTSVGASPSDFTFQVWDGNSNTLDSITYDITSSSTWFSISPTSGTSNSPTNKQTHSIIFDTDDLIPGLYSEDISVYDSSRDSEQIITVNLTVSNNSYIVTDPTSLSYTINVGDSLSSDIFEVWDGNDSLLDSITYTISENVDWLSITPLFGTSDSSNNKVSHSISFDTTGLSPGIYNTNIEITDSTVGTVNIPIQIDVETGAYLVCDTSSILVILNINEEYDNQFLVWDGSLSLLDYINYSIQNNESWLTISPLLGSSDSPADKDSYNYHIDTFGLNSGTYYDTITITNNENESDILTIDVTLIVNQISKTGVAYGAYLL